MSSIHATPKPSDFFKSSSAQTDLMGGLPAEGMEPSGNHPQSQGMTGLVASFSNLSRARLQAGDFFSPRVLPTLGGSPVHVPDGQAYVHLQLRRYAGCPVCSLHL